MNLVDPEGTLLVNPWTLAIAGSFLTGFINEYFNGGGWTTVVETAGFTCLSIWLGGLPLVSTVPMWAGVTGGITLEVVGIGVSGVSSASSVAGTVKP